MIIRGGKKQQQYRHYLPDVIVSPHNPVSVIVAGCGGNGSQIITDLARMHFSLKALGHPGLHVHAFDKDNVSEANVGRQLFSRADVGLPKVTVLLTRVNHFFGLNWSAYPIMLSKTVSLNLDERKCIAITAVDSAPARIMLSDVLSDISYQLDVGNMKSSGQVILGTSEQGIKQPKKVKDAIPVSRLPRALDLYPDMAKEDKEAHQGPSCSVADSLRKQDLFINRCVATAAVELLWRAFREGYISYSGVFINLKPVHTERSMPIDPEAWSAMGWSLEAPLRKVA